MLGPIETLVVLLQNFVTFHGNWSRKRISFFSKTLFLFGDVLFHCCYQKGKGAPQEQPKSLLPFSVDNLKGCKEDNISLIDSHLESRSYIFDYEPTSLDREVFLGIKDRNITSWQNFPNLERWYNHLKSFSDEDLRRFTVFQRNYHV